MNDQIAAALAALAETATRLGALPGRTDERWLAPATGDGWSAHEALAHLRASDDIFRPRLLQVVVRDEPLLLAWDERHWQEVAAYGRLPAALLLSGFSSGREELLHALRSLPEAAWQRTGIHEQRGQLTLLQLAQGMATHEREHVDQIVSALTGAA